ncbi:DUF4253 domain-containing protein [Streptomyces sp. PanSC9]|uniref:DUF4253 domain-containing protein n=1 Tax=Streptomyces sp. PanSC9 TaxID=1520461 RepID=UPI0037DA690F
MHAGGRLDALRVGHAGRRLGVPAFRVVALSYARLDLSVAAPPQTLDVALAVAGEHFAFCLGDAKDTNDRRSGSAADLARWNLSRVLARSGTLHFSGEEAYRVRDACAGDRCPAGEPSARGHAS